MMEGGWWQVKKIGGGWWNLGDDRSWEADGARRLVEAGRKIVEVDGGSWEADGERRMDESGRRTVEAGRRTMKGR